MPRSPRSPTPRRLDASTPRRLDASTPRRNYKSLLKKSRKKFKFFKKIAGLIPKSGVVHCTPRDKGTMHPTTMHLLRTKLFHFVLLTVFHKLLLNSQKSYINIINYLRQMPIPASGVLFWRIKQISQICLLAIWFI